MERSCHKCVHVSVCKLYNKLRRFGDYFEKNIFWSFGVLCLYYHEKEV